MGTPTKIGMGDRERKAVARVLGRVLADEQVLLVRTKNYHWNVEGPHFEALHKFFDAQYEELAGFVDEVAERIRALGERTPGTLGEFVKGSQLKERPGETPKAMTMVASLLADHESVIRSLRRDLEECARLKDMGTSDYLTGLMEEHEKMAWMLRAHLGA